MALGWDGSCWLIDARLNTSTSSPSSRSTCTLSAPPPSAIVVNSVSPVSAKGCPSSTTLKAVRGPDADSADAFFGIMLVTPMAALHTRVCSWPGCTNPYMAVPSVCNRPVCVLLARVVVETPLPGIPSCTAPPPSLRAQSCPRIVVPSLHRAARTNTRLTRPLPAVLAAMQNGTHGATGRHAISPLSALSCPHLGTSHTVASSSRHVPREMQSCVVAPPLVVASYRVYDHRTGFTYRSTPAHVYSPAASGSENSASSLYSSSAASLGTPDMGRIAHSTCIPKPSTSVQLHPSIAVVCMVPAVLLPENALVSAESCTVEYVTAATPSPVSTA